MRRWLLPTICVLIIVGSFAGAVIGVKTHRSIRKYLRSADVAVARYRDALQVDYEGQDTRLTDGLREMEAALTSA